MTAISIDVEADGPIPGDYSMIAIGAVKVMDLNKTFLGYIKPISQDWDPEALAISGFSRENTLKFDDPVYAMRRFESWVKSTGPPPYVFYADNNGFDWSFVNWYMHHFLGSNIFGWSSRNINDIFHGVKLDMRASLKGLRKTKHTHNPVDDAMGNAEALREIITKYNVKGKWE